MIQRRGEDQRGKGTRSTCCWWKWWCWQSFAARLLPSVRHCRGARRISVLWSTLIPPTLSLRLSVVLPPRLRSVMLCSAVHWSYQLFIPRTRARRQELLHHPALTGGKTPHRCSAAARGIDMSSRVISRSQEYVRTFRYAWHGNWKYPRAVMCKH